jgi:hypothetical protein
MKPVVEADVIISTTPEVRTGRRAGDPPGSLSEFLFAVARLADGTRVEAWALSEAAKAALGRVGKDDPALVRGTFAVKAVAGAAVIMINVESCALRLAGFPRPGKGTRMADPEKVAEANREWRETTY